MGSLGTMAAVQQFSGQGRRPLQPEVPLQSGGRGQVPLSLRGDAVCLWYQVSPKRLQSCHGIRPLQFSGAGLVGLIIARYGLDGQLEGNAFRERLTELSMVAAIQTDLGPTLQPFHRVVDPSAVGTRLQPVSEATSRELMYLRFAHLPGHWSLSLHERNDWEPMHVVLRETAWYQHSSILPLFRVFLLRNGLTLPVGGRASSLQLGRLKPLLGEPREITLPLRFTSGLLAPEELRQPFLIQVLLDRRIRSMCRER